MKTDRRGFFRILGGTLAVLFGRPTRARAREEALEIHQATRNTLLGALGERRPRLQRPPSPFQPYSGAERTGLPEVARKPGLPLGQAAQRYAPRSGLGTIISTTLPYSIAFGLAWTVMLVAWILLGLPIGPGAPLRYVAGI